MDYDFGRGDRKVANEIAVVVNTEVSRVCRALNRGLLFSRCVVLGVEQIEPFFVVDNVRTLEVMPSVSSLTTGHDEFGIRKMNQVGACTHPHSMTFFWVGRVIAMPLRTHLD